MKEKLKTIKIDESIWKKLIIIKAEKQYKSIGDTINALIKHL